MCAGELWSEIGIKSIYCALYQLLLSLLIRAMSWNCQFDQEEPGQLSEISVSSRIKEPRVVRDEPTKPTSPMKHYLNISSTGHDELQDKNTPSTNVGSDLEPALNEKNTMTVKQRNMLLGISDNCLRHSFNHSAEAPHIKERVQQLMRQLDQLEVKEMQMHEKFTQDVEGLRESLRTRTRRNAAMKVELDSLRKELYQSRQEMKILIHLLKSAASTTSRQEQTSSPKPLQTLKQYESKKMLLYAERHEVKLQNSQEKVSDKKIKLLPHGRRLKMRDKSDEERQFHNYS